MERWLPITYPDFAHAYEISDHGKLKSLPRRTRNARGEWITKGRIIKPGKHPYGYEVVCLKADGKKKMERIHRLVALAFIPNPMGLPCINHLDCNPANNHYTNLEWCDQKHNMNYAVKLGRVYDNQAKLTWEKVAIIRRMKDDGVKALEVAKLFDVSRRAIYNIWHGKNWKM